MSSGELLVPDLDRVADVERKQELIAELLEAHGLDALILERPENFAWFTSGGKNTLGATSETVAALFLTPEARLVICGHADTARLFDQEVPGLGMQVKERPWAEPRQALLDDLCRGRQVGSDNGYPRTLNLATHLHELRMQLSEQEIRRLRVLGRNLVHAVEATARGLSVGRSEAEIAGELSYRLIKHQLDPVLLQVWGEGRGQRHPRREYSDQPVQTWAVIGAVARRWGLQLGVSRTVALTSLDPNTRMAHQQASMLAATAEYFSQANWTLSQTFERIKRIYEKTGRPEEWREAPLGQVIGYSASEVPVTPQQTHVLQTGTPLWWHPTAGPALVSDSIQVLEDGFELLTPVEAWPTLEISVKDTTVICPGILDRSL